MNFDLDFYKGKKVFVTGHTGFKGSWLCKMLANAGAIVTGYSLNPPTSPCIHAPFPGKFGAYFTTLTRVAVPIFFMITGYFYGDTVARHKENRQIRKIFYLVVRANSIFFIWNIALGILKRDSIVTYVRKIFTGSSMFLIRTGRSCPLPTVSILAVLWITSPVVTATWAT